MLVTLSPVKRSNNGQGKILYHYLVGVFQHREQNASTMVAFPIGFKLWSITLALSCLVLSQPTPYHECDRQGLAHAYSSPVPFIKDGLLFHLKAAHYQLGPTPLVLLWKDNAVTRYLGANGQQVRVLYGCGVKIFFVRETGATG